MSVVYTESSYPVAKPLDTCLNVSLNELCPLCVLQLFSGLLVNLDDIADWLKWLKWFSIFRYGLDVSAITCLLK